MLTPMGPLPSCSLRDVSSVFDSHLSRPLVELSTRQLEVTDNSFLTPRHGSVCQRNITTLERTERGTVQFCKNDNSRNIFFTIAKMENV